MKKVLPPADPNHRVVYVIAMAVVWVLVVPAAWPWLLVIALLALPVWLLHSGAVMIYRVLVSPKTVLVCPADASWRRFLERDVLPSLPPHIEVRWFGVREPSFPLRMILKDHADLPRPYLLHIARWSEHAATLEAELDPLRRAEPQDSSPRRAVDIVLELEARLSPVARVVGRTIG